MSGDLSVAFVDTDVETRLDREFHRWLEPLGVAVFQDGGHALRGVVSLQRLGDWTSASLHDFVAGNFCTPHL